MSGYASRGWFGFLVLAVLMLSGCGSSTPLNRAPVEDRGIAGSAVPAVNSGASSNATASAAATAVKPPLGIENAGKPGFYTVKPGDTLIRIGLETGQSRNDIARWNALENPNRIEVGQVLRIVPPVAETAVVAKPVSAGAVTTTPIASPSTAAAPVPAKTASAPAAAAAKPATAAPVAAVGGSEEEIAWIWPAKGNVIAEFDEAKNKGLDIAGSAGDAVLASADGKVVYAGAGLRGYGNLIILKHNNTYLTAYAHNQSLLVKEDQSVKKGQKIAEMGNTDADKVKLHFEVRRQGKPVDPLKYLPAK